LKKIYYQVSGSPALLTASRCATNLFTAGTMLRGKRRITVASPYLDRLKAFTGGRGRTRFGAIAVSVVVLAIRLFVMIMVGLES
jgi:hypothetical protein